MVRALQRFTRTSDDPHDESPRRRRPHPSGVVVGAGGLSESCWQVSLLRLDSVCVSRRLASGETPVLRNVSLDVWGGEVVGVCGGRLAGKTTLLRVAAGILTPVSGRVSFGGRAIDGQLGIVGWVGSDGPLVEDLPIDALIALPLLRQISHRLAHRTARSVLARVGAGDYADYCWAELAQRERALVSIAQSLIREPRVLVVDDVARGLSALEQEYVVSLLRTLAEDDDLAVLVAASDTAALASAHRLHLLTEGRLVDPQDEHHRYGA